MKYALLLVSLLMTLDPARAASTASPYDQPFIIGGGIESGYSFVPVTSNAHIVGSVDANGVIFISAFNDYGWISPFYAIPIGTTESGSGIKTFPLEATIENLPPNWYIAQSHLTSGYATIVFPEPTVGLTMAAFMLLAGRRRH